jgi:hypothetical protein
LRHAALRSFERAAWIYNVRPMMTIAGGKKREFYSNIWEIIRPGQPKSEASSTFG